MRRIGVTLVLALAACGSEQAGVDNGSQGTAQVRMMNASAGTPALDLIVGGRVIAGGIPSGQSSALASMPGGAQMLAVRQAGQSVNLASRAVTIVPNATYALVVSGSLASLTLTPTLAPATLDTGRVKPDRANIRVINIGADFPRDSASAPPSILLDVYITAPGADLGSVSPTFSMDARYSNYGPIIYFDPGDWVVRFTNAGTKTVVASTVTMPIAAGEARAVTLQRTDGGGFSTSVVAEN